MSAATLLGRPRRGQDAPPQLHRRRRLVLVLAAAFVAVLALTWVVAFSPVFGVRTVQVRGGALLSDQQIRTAADIARGTPLLRLDTDAVRARLQKLPEIASATVDTSFPSTVTITVRERTAVGYREVGTRFALLDRDAVAFRTVGSRPAGLPALVLSSDAGTQVVTARAVAAVATSLPKDLRSRVRSVEAMGADALTLVLRDGTLIMWGGSGRNADKARVADILVRRGAERIDVSDPDRPFTRPGN